jgi:hypothetical protein
MAVGRVMAVALSVAVGAYAGVWLLVQAFPSYESTTDGLHYAFALGSDARSVEYGYELLRSGNPDDTRQSIEVFQNLLRRNPASPSAWCDLGDALLDAKRPVDAQRCFSRASELGGRLPPIMLRIVNFYCRLPDASRALALSNELLKLSGEYDSIVFGLYTRLHIDTNVLLDHGIGANARGLNSYLQYALHRSDFKGATSAWARLQSMSGIDSSAAVEYVTRMYKAGFRADSSAAWLSYSGRLQSDYRRSNFIFNGDFERPLTRAVFDWNLPSEPYIDVAVDQSTACSGQHSLRLAFIGNENPAYEGPWQIAWVAPGSYSLEACVQTENLSSSEGLRFRLFSSESPRKLLSETEQIGGTGSWRRIRQRFIVPAGTKAVEIRLVRDRSWKFENRVAGTAGVDDVKLVPTTEVTRQ